MGADDITRCAACGSILARYAAPICPTCALKVVQDTAPNLLPPERRRRDDPPTLRLIRGGKSPNPRRKRYGLFD